MTDIDVHLYDDPIVNHSDSYELPPASEIVEDWPDIAEAIEGAALLIAVGQLEGRERSAAIMLNDLFFMGYIANGTGPMTRILTPAAEAWLDEHDMDWRLRSALPLTQN